MSTTQHLPSGPTALLKGFSLLGQKGLRAYALIPVLINMVIFATGFYYGFEYIDQLQAQFANWLPEWLEALSYALYIIFIIGAVLIMAFVFTSITQLLASPFNAILSERVEKHLGLNTASEENSLTFFQALKSAVPREIKKLLKSLKWLVLMLVFSFVPGLNILVPVIASWLLAIDYLDYPADNRGMNFDESLKIIASKRFSHLLFGLTVSFFSIIPILNWFVVPAAVAGGTALWHKSRR